MATTVLGLKTFAASDPVDYNEINDNYTKIDNGVKTALQGRAAHNLLDNSWFVNPINQRGRTGTYEGVENYTTFVLDRWKTWSTGCSYTIASTGLQITNKNTSYTAGPWEVLPNPERMKGKTYTLAVGYGGGNVVCGSVTVPSGSVTADKYVTAVSAAGAIPGLRLIIYANDQHVEFQIMVVVGQTVTVEWAALYEGSYTADTLPAYVPKGYAAELAECQRYYYQTTISNAVAVIASGHAHTSEIARFVMTLPQPMRIKPSFSFTAGSYIRIIQNGGTFNGTDISLNDAEDSTKQKMIFFVTSSGLTSYAQAGLMIPGSTLKFYADL